MSNGEMSLDALYAHLDTVAEEPDESGAGWAAHSAILDRLAANRRLAEASGWTALALERDGERGRFRLVGIPPGRALRADVPDLATRSW